MGQPWPGRTGEAPPMPPRPAGRAEVRPSRWWYVLAAVIVTTSLAVTGGLGAVTAFDLVERVEGFQRFDAPGSWPVTLTEPGDYSVYHERLSSSGAGGSVEPDFAVVVTGPDGADVPVRPSDVTYGWGSRRAAAVGSFTAEQPGDYQLHAEGAHGRLAVGESIPGGWLYGFGPTLLAGAAAALAGLLMAVVVAVRRRRSRRTLDDDPGYRPAHLRRPDAPRPGPTTPPATALALGPRLSDPPGPVTVVPPETAPTLGPRPTDPSRPVGGAPWPPRSPAAGEVSAPMAPRLGIRQPDPPGPAVGALRPASPPPAGETLARGAGTPDDRPLVDPTSPGPSEGLAVLSSPEEPSLPARYDDGWPADGWPRRR